MPPAASYAYTAAPPNPHWGATPESNPATPPTTPPYAPFTPVNPTDPNAAFPPADPYTVSRSRFPGGAIWLIAIGSIFLIGNMGFFHEFPARPPLMPIFLIGFGVWLFVRKMTCPSQDSYNLRVFRALRGSIWVMLLGLLLLLDSFDLPTWSHSWPLLLIVAGAMALFRTHRLQQPPRRSLPLPLSCELSDKLPHTARRHPLRPQLPATSIVPYESNSHDDQEGR